ncbi:hypothetical protein FVF58_23120 [Paraburkholderia panacisoli]|uniref:Glycosyl transferase family 2 n=1 Tax=Paraburkholderia panacisoli TaxID=2603818 RepID=A0A5B0GZG7_9BURK|nr:glycosyltransferase family 2 protein [Paraburkholderia panacisoli]KAA1008229.1 hypothetical protein FVF58_23120 [Paraburkholderia panacisoli]
MSEIKLSFCIPVMNRLSDIQATLRQNLADNLDDRGEIEFILVCFDKDDKTARWVSDNFRAELASGYLRFYQSDSLEAWHFGKAKNAFHNLIKGKIYASLDGDNFTGPGGGRHIIDIFEDNAYDCILHQFQGDWGDGTCGRVSLTAEDYRSIGYDDSFLPRQWDELDAILSILVHRPSRHYVCYSGKSIAKKSQPFARFLSENGIQLKTIELDPDSDPLRRANRSVAVGQNRNSYVQDDERLKYSSIFNHLSSFFKNTPSDALRIRYTSELVEIQRTMAEKLDIGVLNSWYLVPTRADAPVVEPEGIVLTACIRNEEHLEEWLDHYRGLGVTHFLLVDDGSKDPISKRIKAKDVWVWKPKCGRFRYSKAFWLELLLRSHARNRWAITVDSDEYLELPQVTHDGGGSVRPPETQLHQLIKWAHGQNIRYFAGFLLDLMPDHKSLPAIRSRQALPRGAFNHYQFRPATISKLYQRQNTVKWSYSEHANWIYQIDIRYRLNRAFDSLRKFPIFLVDVDVHLNQGFHDLILAGEKRAAKEIGRPDLLPIRHYKMFSTQQDAASREVRPASSYHHETRVNLERLRKNFESVLAGAAMSPFAYQFLDYSLVPVPGRSQITVRAEGAGRMISSNEWFGMAVLRSADIFVKLTNGATCLRNGAIEARTMDEAVDWLRAMTPFSTIVDRSVRHVTLTLERDVNSEVRLPSGIR